MNLPETRAELRLNSNVIHDLEMKMAEAKGQEWMKLQAKLIDARDYRRQLRSRRDRLLKQRAK